MKDQIREEPRVVAAAERQMQAWSQAERSRSIASGGAKRHAPLVGPFVAISREAGAGGSEVAQKLGAKIGWEVLDRNLLDCIASRFHLNKSALKLVDETESNWIRDFLGSWMDSNLIPHEKYVTHLTRIVLAAARHGQVIFVGRGAGFLLPRDCGFSVRLVASRPFRVRRIASQESIDFDKAEKFVDSVDRGRREFVQRYFHHDVEDPHLYDMVLNVERLGIDGAVAQILTAMPC